MSGFIEIDEQVAQDGGPAFPIHGYCEAAFLPVLTAFADHFAQGEEVGAAVSVALHRGGRSRASGADTGMRR